MLKNTFIYDIDPEVYNKAKVIKRCSFIGTVTGLLIAVAGLFRLGVGEKMESEGIECLGD